jgi:hypothetical protein
MHPAVLIIAASAAKGFGEGFGTELGKKLFGTSSSDLRLIRQQLAEILRRLDVIEEKLDAVLTAVGNLPSVIIGNHQQELVDEAYRQLDSYYVILRTSTQNRIPTPSVSDKALLLKCWFTLTDLECRPQLLMNIPFWTEFVRRCVVIEIDNSLTNRLQTKSGKMRGALDLSENTLSSLFETAQVLLSQGHFTEVKISGAAPYFSYKIAAAPMVERWHREHCSAPERYYIPDPYWGNKVAAQENKIKAISIEIDRETSTYNATYPAWALLKEYIPFLNKSGMLDSAPELLKEIEELQLVKKKAPLAQCD